MRKHTFFTNPLFLSLSIIVLIIFWVSANMNWGDKRWHKLLKIDGVGYYSYLPAVFIYNDLNFQFYDTIKLNNPRPELDYNFRTKTAAGTTNKYYSGTAISMLPFFLGAHFYSKLSGQISDGYSFYYLLSIQIAALFYLIIGLIAMSEVLKHYQISLRNRALVILAIVFGSNIFYYVVHEPFMSHLYSFAFINLLVLSILNLIKTEKLKWLYLAAFSLGLIFLIRPVNLLVLLSIPFLISDINTTKKMSLKLKENGFQFLVSIILFAALASIQFIIYKIQTGSFIIYSYGKETINLSEPHFIDFLFSYRKGFFIWAPLMFLSLWGIKFIYKKNPYQLIWWMVFMLSVIYILSSWWAWYYGGSFGSRVMIDYLIYFTIPLGLLLQKTSFKKLVISVVIILCFVTQIQTFQYVKGYIHWSEMNKEWYWDNFLRIDKVLDKADKPWGNDDK